MEWWVYLTGALIAGPVMWFLHRFDRRNTEQHGNNMAVLERIEKKVDHIDDRVDHHINWHLGSKDK